MKYALTIFLILGLAVSVSAETARIHTETVTYTVGGETMEGYLAYQKEVEGKQPGILVVHE